tara:strand:- start:557 stop:775 length:219 start_codon:yes stop_codon:yes gene_type:complete
VQREDSLDAFIRDDSTDRDGSVDAPSLLGNEDTLVDLDTFLVTFDDSNMHIDRVANAEIGKLFSGLQLILGD